MPIAVQEQSSTFSKTSSRSVQVVGGESNTNANPGTGLGEIYVPMCMDSNNATSTVGGVTSTTTQRIQNIKEVSSVSSRRADQDLSTSTSASSIASDSTLCGGDFPSISQRLGDFTFRPIISREPPLNKQDSGFEDVSRELYHVNDGETFEMKLEVQEFKPDEIQVKITDNVVTIQGKQEERQDQNNFRSRQFSKKFTIPEGVKPETITCNLTPQGVLKISAPIEQTRQHQQGSITTSSGQQQQRVTSSVSKNVTSSVQQQQQSENSSRKSSVSSELGGVNIRSLTSPFGDQQEFIIRPRMDLENLLSRRDLTMGNQEISNTNDGKRFEMKMEIKDFKPDEIEVKISKNLIKIDCKHDSQRATRTFHKEITLPYGVKGDEIQCSFNADNILTLSAPVHSVAETLLGRGSSIDSQESVVSSTANLNLNKQQQQQQQVHSSTSKTVTRQQQESVQGQVSDNSNTSFLGNRGQDALKRFDEDFIIRPTMGLGLEALMNRKDVNFEDVSKQLCHVNDGKKFEMKLEVPDFKPEELQLKIVEGMVVIEGKQESATSSRQFYKKFSIPQGVKPENITSSLSPKGVLTISAPIEASTPVTSSVAKTTSVQQQQSVKQQQQSTTTQQQRQQQQTAHSDSTSSINSNFSNVSSLRDELSKRFDEDFILRPIMDFENLIARESNFEDVSKQVSQANDGKKFEMKLDVPDFKPEELTVKISNNMVSIQGKQEMQESNNFSSRQFSKKFSIPHGVKPEDITSSLSPKGVLTISAPIHQQSQPQQSIQSSNRVEEQSVKRQQQQHQQSVQQTVHSDSASSINSNKSSSNTTQKSRFDQDFVLRPVMDLESLMSHRDAHFEDITKDISQQNDSKKFETKLQVGEFQPEELQVKISNNMVSIEAKHQDQFSSRQFSKKFSIPQGVKPENITSSLSPSGVLTISAPIELKAGNSNVQSVTSVQKTSTTSSSTSGNQGQRLNDFVFRPKFHSGDMVSSVNANSSFEDISKEICQVNDGKHFEMKLEVQEFKPEEIEVKIANQMVTVEGKQEIREENNSRSRQFYKKFSIPQGVKPESITCSLSPEGRLTISAPVESQPQNQALTSSTTTGGVSNQEQSSTTSSTSKKVSSSSTFSSTSSTNQSSSLNKF